MGLSRLFSDKDKFTTPTQTIVAACGCHVGKKRKNNEDNFLFNGQFMPSNNNGLGIILEKELSLKKDRFFAVFDGMGGGDYGELASFTAAQTVRNFLNAHEIDSAMEPALFFEQMSRQTGEAVYRRGQELGVSLMGSTLAGLYFRNDIAWVCNLGDSRCFLLRNGHLQQISKDHTDEAFMQENGITGRKPYLTQYLGVDPDEMSVSPYVQSIPVQTEDLFLICSDGVTDMVSQDALEILLSAEDRPQLLVKKVINAALHGGGKDNITAIVIQII